MDVDSGCRKFPRRQLGPQGGDDRVEALLVRRARDDLDAVPVGVLHCLQVELQRRLSILSFLESLAKPRRKITPSRAPWRQKKRPDRSRATQDRGEQESSRGAMGKGGEKKVGSAYKRKESANGIRVGRHDADGTYANM